MTKIQFLFLAAMVSGDSLAAPAQRLDYQECQIELEAWLVDAECATLRQPLDLTQAGGQTIDIFVAKFPATSPNPLPDPLTIIQGGPGSSSIDLALQLLPLLEPVRRHRDIIVVDQRGTGRSNALLCPSTDEQAFANFDAELVRQSSETCLTQLQTDVRHYTTSVAVQDLMQAIERSGYKTVNIYGVSYGTRVAQHFARRFPQVTRSLILDGVADLGVNLAGSEIALRSQQAFNRLVNQCNALPWCQSQHGDLAQVFAQLRANLAEAPVEVQLPHPNSGKRVNETIGEGHLLALIRLLPYSSEGLSLLPLILSEAANGNFTPLAATMITIDDQFRDSYATGMNNSVVCSEDFPFLNDADLTGAEQTFFGNDFAEALRVVCELWPRGPVDADFHARFSSDIPALILSGAIDPITPPDNGTATAAMFSNSKHVVVPHHAHGVISRGCIPQLVMEFLQNATPSDLNTDCVKREQAIPAFIDASGPAP